MRSVLREWEIEDSDFTTQAYTPTRSRPKKRRAAQLSGDHEALAVEDSRTVRRLGR
ncbi:MAG: hypothetical protein ABIZ05_07090 [Pseudonocardiaceae bacterium]